MVARPQANDFAFGGHFDPPFSRYDFRMSDGKKVEGKELVVRNDFAFGGHFDPPFSRYDFRMSDGKKVEGKELVVR